MKIKYSRQSREQMVERGISENEVREGIERGAKSFQNPNKIVSDYRYYRIVYKKIKDMYFIITVMIKW